MQRMILFSLAIGLGAVAVGAQEAGEAYNPGEREELARAALPGGDGQEIAIQRVTFAPGWTGDRHEHGGPVFVYVLDGSITVEVDGDEPKTLTAGDLTAEPMNTAMSAQNESDAEPVTLLLIQVSQEGVPLMTRVD